MPIIKNWHPTAPMNFKHRHKFGVSDAASALASSIIKYATASLTTKDRWFIFRHRNDFPGELDGYLRFDVWLDSIIRPRSEFGWIGFLGLGQDEWLLELARAYIFEVQASYPIQLWTDVGLPTYREPHPNSEFRVSNSIETRLNRRFRFAEAASLILSWQQVRCTYSVICAARELLSEHRIQQPIVAISNAGERVSVPLSHAGAPQMAKIITEGVLSFDYRRGDFPVRPMIPDVNDDLGCLYIKPQKSKPVPDDIEAELSAMTDFVERREILIAWLTKEMMTSPYKKTFWSDQLAIRFGTLLGYMEGAEKKSFQSGVWKRAVSVLKREYPDHVWSTPGRPMTDKPTSQ